jgi:hypothetical protein
MKKDFILIVLLLLAALHIGYCQQPTPGQKVTFPSPQAAQLGKFGGYNINHSSGTPNISIPIYTAVEGDISFPINLSYYYTGYKPSEEPGWVGVGWTLSPGVITRTVNVHRDEMSSVGYLANAAKVKSMVSDADPSYTKYQNLVVNNSVNDSQPDEFSFEFHGNSGRFVLNETGQPKIISNKKMEIDYTISYIDNIHSQSSGIINSWTIKTEDGTRYIFKNYEFTSNLSSSSSAWNTTSWYLSEIISIRGRRLAFEYTTPVTSKRTIQTGRTDQQTTFSGPTPNNNSNGSTISTNFSEQIYLTKIKGTGFEIQFGSSDYSRSMAVGYTNWSRKLNTIKVLNTLTATPSVVKLFDLDYNTDTSNKLMLLSVGETGLPAYTMQYANSIPADIEGNTSQVDYWGYYNGQPNTWLIPDFPSVDLEPRFDRTLWGALTRITYPTKGFTTIEWEQNDYSYLQNNAVTKTKIEIEENTYWWLNNAGTIIKGSNPVLVLDGPSQTRVDIKVQAGSSSQSVCQNINNGNFQSIYLNPGSYTGEALLGQGAFYPCNQTMNTPGFDVTLIVKAFHPTTINKIPYGGLRVKSLTDHADDVNDSELVKNYEYKALGASGLSSGILPEESVYKIDYFAQAGDITLYRSAAFNPVSLSPVYYREVQENTPISKTEYKFTSHFDQPLNDGGKWAFFAEPSNQLANIVNPTYNKTLGHYQRYDIMRQLPLEVILRDINGTYKRKTVNTYSGFSQTFAVPELYNEFLTSYTVTTSWGGQQTYEVYYNKALYIIGGWPRKLSETVTTNGTNGSNSIVTSTTYDYDNASHLQLTKKRVSQSDGSILETNYKYPIDYDENASKANYIQTMIDSNMVSYPLEEYTILERSSTNRKVIDATASIYKSFSGLSAAKQTLTLPYKDFKFKGFDGSIGTSFVNYDGIGTESASSSYREMYRYTNYDTKGNLLSMWDNGTNISYLWSYKGQYPVAEIKNASYSAVNTALSTAGTSFSSLSALDVSTDIKSKLNLVQDALSTALMTYYLYEPLKGISSVTDPAEKTLFYEYDDFGRLSKIKNTNVSGSLRASFCYNYAGQETDCGSVVATGVITPAQLYLLSDGAARMASGELLFGATKEQKTALLTWSAPEEFVIEGFTVQHSLDGKKWTDLGHVDHQQDIIQNMASNSDSLRMYYAFQDANPGDGDNYYRLRYTSAGDTAIAFSQAEKLFFENDRVLYPNPLPVGDLLHISSSDMISQLDIYNSQGTLVLSISKVGSELDISALPTGSYIVQMTGTNKAVSVHRIVKE